MAKENKRTIFCKALGLALLLTGLFYADAALAAQGEGIGSVAKTIIGNFGDLAKLITAGAYVAGMGFAVGAILKFKAHKDNPTQIPIGTPIALIFIAAALIFLPSIFSTAGSTLFKSGGTTGSISGTVSF